MTVAKSPEPSTNGGGPGGIPVDIYGGPTVDPTANVLQLVSAEGRRQDDLRNSEGRLTDSKITSAERRLDDLRIADNRRLEELSLVGRGHIKEILELRASYDEKISILRASHDGEMRQAEARRIDAIRLVDTGAVTIAAERQAAAAQILATTGAQQAETLRTLVETRSVALATQTAATLQPIIEQIASLQKAQYEGAGRSLLADPQSQQLTAEVRSMRELIASSAGAKLGATESITERRNGMGTALAIIGAVVGVLGFGAALFFSIVGVAIALLLR